MGQNISNEISEETYNSLRIKIKEYLTVLNNSVKNISIIPVYFVGDINNVNGLLTIYLDCMYWDGNITIDEDVIRACKLSFVIKDNKVAHNILNDCISAYILYAGTLCRSLLNCSQISYSLMEINNMTREHYPTGIKLVIYPIF